MNNNNNKESVFIDLSVVILTKNEENLIGECIESVISAVKYATEKRIIKTSEIILVDSASTDKTIDIATKLKYTTKRNFISLKFSNLSISVFISS